VNLSNSKYCANTKPCQERGLPPIQLRGVGGSIDPIRKAGFITAIAKGHKKIAHACILDQEVAGNKAICLMGLHTPIDWDVGLSFRVRESCQGEHSPLRLNAVHELKRSKTATRLRKPARSNWLAAFHPNHAATCERPNITSTEQAANSRTQRCDVNTRHLNTFFHGMEEALVANSYRVPLCVNARKIKKF
jgi:hypothetical protein